MKNSNKKREKPKKNQNQNVSQKKYKTPKTGKNKVSKEEEKHSTILEDTKNP